MACTTPPFISQNAESSYSHSVLTDWLHLSPFQHELTSPATKDIAVSSNDNVDGFESTQEYSLDTLTHSNGSHGMQTPSKLNSPCLQKVLVGTNSQCLPLCTFTPSPGFPSVEHPDVSDVCSQSPPKLALSSPAFRSSSNSFSSQESYDMNVSPLGALFYFRDDTGSFQSDASPVIRTSQEALVTEFSDEADSRQAHATRLGVDKFSRSKFTEKLQTINREAGSSDTSPLRNSSGLLGSPCKLNASTARWQQPCRPDRSSLFSSIKQSEATRHPVQNGPLKTLALVASMNLPPGCHDNVFPASRPLKRQRCNNADKSSALNPPPKRLHTAVVLDHGPSKEALAQPNPAEFSQSTAPNRIFPSSVDVLPALELLYRRSPASSYFQPPGERYVGELVALSVLCSSRLS